MKLLSLLLLASSAFAYPRWTPERALRELLGPLMPQYVAVAFTHSGGGTPTLLTHTTAHGNGTTSSAISALGATLIVIVATDGATPTTPTDSQSNIYTGQTVYQDGNNSYYTQIFYICGPSVSSSMTFTAHGTNPNIEVSTWSGTLSASCVDGTGTGGSQAFGTTVQCSSQSPGTTNELIVSGLAIGTSGVTPTIDSALTILDFSTGTFPEGSHAYLVNPGAGIAPTWTMGGGSHPGATACTLFKHS